MSETEKGGAAVDEDELGEDLVLRTGGPPCAGGPPPAEETLERLGS